MKQVGTISGVPVMDSPFVEKGYVYFVDKRSMELWKIPGFKPITKRQAIKRYFKNIWQAIKDVKGELNV